MTFVVVVVVVLSVFGLVALFPQFGPCSVFDPLLVGPDLVSFSWLRLVKVRWNVKGSLISKLEIHAPLIDSFDLDSSKCSNIFILFLSRSDSGGWFRTSANINKDRRAQPTKLYPLANNFLLTSNNSITTWPIQYWPELINWLPPKQPLTN